MLSWRFKLGHSGALAAPLGHSTHETASIPSPGGPSERRDTLTPRTFRSEDPELEQAGPKRKATPPSVGPRKLVLARCAPPATWPRLI